MEAILFRLAFSSLGSSYFLRLSVLRGKARTSASRFQVISLLRGGTFLWGNIKLGYDWDMQMDQKKALHVPKRKRDLFLTLR